LGSIGYMIERHYRGVPTTPYRQQSINDEREERLLNTRVPTVNDMSQIVPKTIFGKNDPDILRKKQKLLENTN
ncbi:unnamed protein product, partial [Didymodactylos carnosus]